MGARFGRVGRRNGETRTMAHHGKSFVVLRESAPAERREDMAVLLLGSAYSLIVWTSIGWQLWRLWRQL
jgi:hypothetical protein